MNTAGLLEQHARERGDRLALACDDRHYSFADLDGRANRVANAMRSLGVSKGDRLAIYAGNSPEWVEAFFAASKLGAVLVPISARLLTNELAHVVNETRPVVLVFDDALGREVQRLRQGNSTMPRLVRINSVDASSSDGPDQPAMPSAADYEALVGAADGRSQTADVQPHDVHSICYTAGTTGRPKGAVLTDANVVVGTHEMGVANFGYSERDVFLNPAPLAHRAGWARLIQSVGVGAPHVLVRRFDAEPVLRLIERYRVTIAGLVPTMIRMIDEASVSDRFDLSSLRTIIATAEACPPTLRKRIFELFPGVELLTLFASTEAGLIAVLPSVEQLRRPTAAGRPLEGVDVRVVDSTGRELVPAEEGEFHVRTGGPGTAGVMLGYLDGQSASAECFENGWFPTGDCGHVDDEGYLYVSDRKKDMILSGGLNIFSREVEHVLLQHEGVRDVAVVGVPDPTWGESVLAVVVRAPEASVSAGMLIEHSRSLVASYKKPRRIEFVDELPRNAAGKVQKYRLRERFGGRD